MSQFGAKIDLVGFPAKTQQYPMSGSNPWFCDVMYDVIYNITYEDSQIIYEGLKMGASSRKVQNSNWKHHMTQWASGN